MTEAWERYVETKHKLDRLLKAAKEAIQNVEELRENDKGLATKFPDSYRGGIPGAVDETFRRVLITLEDLRAAVAAAEGEK